MRLDDAESVKLVMPHKIWHLYKINLIYTNFGICLYGLWRLLFCIRKICAFFQVLQPNQVFREMRAKKQVWFRMQAWDHIVRKNCPQSKKKKKRSLPRNQKLMAFTDVPLHYPRKLRFLAFTGEEGNLPFYYVMTKTTPLVILIMSSSIPDRKGQSLLAKC